MSDPTNGGREPTDADLRAHYERALVTGPPEPVRTVTPEALRDLVEGAGPEEARMATLDRVMADGHLRREFELLRATAAAARAVDPAGRPARRLTAFVTRWSLAAAACVLVALGVGGVWRRGRLDDAPAGDRMRGGSLDAGGTDARVSLTAAALPASGDVLTLAWHPVAGATRYDVEILGPDGGTSRLAESTTDTTLVIPAARAAAVRAGDRWWVRARLAGGGTVRSPVAPISAR